MDDQSRYFQTVAHHFLGPRGGAFFLSPKEMQFLESWEREGIPLFVVLDAIHAFFGGITGGKAGKLRRKEVRLSHCQKEVRRHYEAWKERRVGVSDRNIGDRDKRERISEAVESFLKDTPRAVSFLIPLFHRAQEVLREEEMEEELESLDSDIEDALILEAPREVRKTIQRQVADLELLDDMEEQRIFRLKLIKYMRSRFRIPFLSLFYY